MRLVGTPADFDTNGSQISRALKFSIRCNDSQFYFEGGGMYAGDVYSCRRSKRTVRNGDSGSIIAEMEKNPAYPRVFRLENNQELKITKTNFKKALEDLIEEQYI